MLFAAKNNQILYAINDATARMGRTRVNASLKMPYGNIYPTGANAAALIPDFLQLPPEKRAKSPVFYSMGLILTASGVLYSVTSNQGTLENVNLLGEGCMLAYAEDGTISSIFETAMELTDTLEAALELAGKSHAFPKGKFVIAELSTIVAEMEKEGRTDTPLNYLNFG